MLFKFDHLLPHSNMDMLRKFIKRPSTHSILLVASAWAMLLLFAGCGKNSDSEDKPDQVYTVSRGDFNVLISANGTLYAVKRY